MKHLNLFELNRKEILVEKLVSYVVKDHPRIHEFVCNWNINSLKIRAIPVDHKHIELIVDFSKLRTNKIGITNLTDFENSLNGVLQEMEKENS